MVAQIDMGDKSTSPTQQAKTLCYRDLRVAKVLEHRVRPDAIESMGGKR
jgi:hypothetical protein